MKEKETLQEQDVEQPVQESASCNPPLKVVVPLREGSCALSRLMLLDASLKRYLRAEYELLVCCDDSFRPAQLPAHATCIPYAPDCTHDVKGAIVTAVKTESIDRFVVFPLETFLCNGCIPAYFALPMVRAYTSQRDYETHFPMYIIKDVMARLISQQEMQDLPGDADLLAMYYEQFAMLPVELDWGKDNFLLPVVSPNPGLDTILQYARKKVAVWIEKDEAFESLCDGLFPMIGADDDETGQTD